MLSEGRAFSDWATDAEDAVLASAAAASVDGYSSHDRWSSRASRCCRRSIISSSGCSALPSKRLLRRRCTGARVSPAPARPGHRKLVRRCCPCLRDALAAAAASSLAWFRIAVIWHFPTTDRGHSFLRRLNWRNEVPGELNPKRLVKPVTIPLFIRSILKFWQTAGINALISHFFTR